MRAACDCHVAQFLRPVYAHECCQPLGTDFAFLPQAWSAQQRPQARSCKLTRLHCLRSSPACTSTSKLPKRRISGGRISRAMSAACLNVAGILTSPPPKANLRVKPIQKEIENSSLYWL